MKKNLFAEFKKIIKYAMSFLLKNGCSLLDTTFIALNLLHKMRYLTKVIFKIIYYPAVCISVTLMPQ